jgi:H+/Cl- antiporter ClcA
MHTPTRTLSRYRIWLVHIGKWTALAAIVAVFSGTASAFFLFALRWATDWRTGHRWIVWGLPLAGFAVGWLYLKLGRSVEGGNNLLIDEIHDPRSVIPLRMAPLVCGATIVSHLFGASVGREGTAVQMGGALADQLTHVFRLAHDQRRLLLMASISAGFASVFGTPVAGAIFGIEVLTVSRNAWARDSALAPCLVAAFLADRVGLWWGVQHTHYVMAAVAAFTPMTFAATLVAGAVFGLAARVFAGATHALSGAMKRWVPYAPLRPFIGGSLVALAVWCTASDRYIGLGIPVILDAFAHPLPLWDALGKTMFTVVSLGSGFKGGEVTPLFYIGATLGNALAPLLHLPFSMLAGLGFVALFAGAANTPLASTIMAIELFGPGIVLFAALACSASYLCSGRIGIYRAQRD